MKSLMEEASTLVKAIENAWNRAGKPQEFTVKILEYPETGFLGLTTVKSAKVALFFTESAKPEAPRQRREPQVRPIRNDRINTSSTPRPPRQERPPQRDNRRDQQRPYDRSHYANRDESRSVNPERSERPAYQEPREERPSWTTDMVNAAQEWLKETLVLTGLAEAAIKAHVSQGFLKLIVDRPVADDPRQEEMLLKSWANLAFDAVQEKYKQPLRGLRLVVESKRN